MTASANASIAAASYIETLLSSAATLSAAAGQATTAAVSTILDAQPKGELDPRVANALQRALLQLARIAAPSANGDSSGSATIGLTSKNLNVSIAHRTAAQLSQPISCPTDSEPVAAAFPAGMLLAMPSADEAAPVSILLYSSAVNLHAAGCSPPASPFVSLSLLQHGAPLRIANAPHPINLSLPIAIEVDGQRPPAGGDGMGDALQARSSALGCTGHDVARAAGCSSHLECRWWDAAAANWSSAGCSTYPGGEGAVRCACDHLTDFMVFEVPTTLDDLVEDIVQSFAVNGLSIGSVHCLLSATPASMPHAYTILFALLTLATMLLAHATTRDADEIAMVERLVAGRRREHKARLRRLLSSWCGDATQMHLLRWTSRFSSRARLTTTATRATTERQRTARGSSSSGSRGSETLGVDLRASLPEPSSGSAVAACAEAIGVHIAEDEASCNPLLQPPAPTALPPPPLLIRGSSSTISDIDAAVADAAAADMARTVRMPAQLGGRRTSWGSASGDETSNETPPAPPDSVAMVETIAQGELEVAAAGNGRVDPAATSPAATSPRRPKGRFAREAPPLVEGDLQAVDLNPLAGDAAGSTAELRVSERSPLVNRSEGARADTDEREAAALRIQRSARLKRYSRRFHDAAALAALPSPLRQLGRSGSIVARSIVSVFRTAIQHSPTARGRVASSHRKSAAKNWRRARQLKTQVVLARRWHSDVDRSWKRMALACKGSHTLVAGVFCRGSMGYTRAQTCMVLLNSLALELVVLCMLYSQPNDGPLVINPIKIASTGVLAALICIPGMLLFTCLFTPQLFLNAPRRLGRLFVACLLPRRVHRAARDEAGTRSFNALRRGTVVQARGSDAAQTNPAERRSHTEGMPRRSSSCQVDPVSSDATTQPSCYEHRGAGVGHGEQLDHHAPGCYAAGHQAEEHCGTTSAQASPIESLHAPCAQAAPSRDGYSHFSFASLNEHMLRHSLRRTVRMRDWRAVGLILLGWCCNWIAFAVLLIIFMLYGCDLSGAFRAPGYGEALLLSWTWSVAQRFLVNEPMLIGLAKGLPMLFSSAICANVCSESCANTLALVTEVVANFCKALTRG